jgi:hypothetical protein
MENEDSNIERTKRNFFIISGVIIISVLTLKIYSDYRIGKLK